MTVDIAEQIDRIQFLVQDPVEQDWTRAKILEQHARELTQLSRRNLFGRIEWVNAVADTSQYTLDNVVTETAMVLYNEKILTYASEANLDRRYRGWEGLSREPEYWTVNHQTPQVLRIVPAPVRTGSTTFQFPAVPLPISAVDNLVVFFFEDVGPLADNEGDPFPVLDFVEDVAVWRTTQALAEQEREVQDLALAAVCGQLAALWLRQMGIGDGQ